MRALLVVALLSTNAHAIVGGTPSDVAAVVALVRGDELVCSGVVIAPHAVLTAAHCVAGSDPFEVLVGGERRVPVAKVIAPDFERTTLAGDVAIVVFDQPLPVAPLVVAPTLARASGLMTIIGFGRTAPDDTSPFMQRTGGALLAMFDEHALVSHGPQFTCEGDSGGPALMDGSIVGITSSGDEACAEHSRHTRISAYAAFIAATLRATSPGGASAGDRCWYVANCADADCVAALDEPRLSFCAPACTASCADGLACVEGLCRHPAPSPGAEGAFCHSAQDCVGDLCVAPDESRASVCTRRCFSDLPGFDCPTGTACSVGEDGKEACFAPANNGCTASPPSSWALALLVLAQLLRGRGKP